MGSDANTTPGPKVAIDGHVLSGKHQGSRTVLVRLLKALQLSGRSKDYAIYTADPAAAAEALGHTPYDIRPVNAPSALARLLTSMPRHLRNDQMRVAVWQYVVSPLAFSQRNVVFIYDILPFTHPHLFPLAFRIKCVTTHFFSMLVAARICTESKTAVEEIKKLFPFFASKLRLVRCGPSFEPEVYFSDKASMPGPTKRYALTVGRIEARRNIDMLVRAFDRAAPGDVDLIIVGKRDLGFQVATELPANVSIVENVADADLIELYRGACLFIYPSSAEGFGIPLLDAVLFGLPCISSNRTALPEVGGGHASYFDPDTPNAEAVLSEMILAHFAGDTARSGTKAERQSHAELFDWQASALCFDAIVNELIAN